MLLLSLDQALYHFAEAVASMDVAGEEVEARTGGREQDGVAWLSHLTSVGDSLLHGECRGDLRHLAVEALVQLQHVGREEDEPTRPRGDELGDIHVVIPLVFATEDEHVGRGHRPESIVGGADVGGLGVVDIAHAIEYPDLLEAVGDVHEVAERTSQDIMRDAETQGCDRGGHSILQVVRPLECELIDGELKALPVEVQAHHIVVRLVGGGAYLRIGQEGERLHRHGLVAHDIARDELIFTPIDEGILCGLVLQDAHLRHSVLLEVVVIAVEVVGGDIHQEGDMHAELVHIIQLEATQLDDEVVGLLVGDHLTGEAEADVPSQCGLHTRLGEDVVQPHGRRGLPIAPRDTDDLTLEVATCQLDLGDDGDATLTDSHHDRRLLRDTRALDDLLGTQDELGGVATLFVGDAIGFELLLVLRGNMPVVRDHDGYTTTLV